MLATGNKRCQRPKVDAIECGHGWAVSTLISISLQYTKKRESQTSVKIDNVGGGDGKRLLSHYSYA